MSAHKSVHFTACIMVAWSLSNKQAMSVRVAHVLSRIILEYIVLHMTYSRCRFLLPNQWNLLIPVASSTHFVISSDCFSSWLVYDLLGNLICYFIMYLYEVVILFCLFTFPTLHLLQSPGHVRLITINH